MKRVVHLTSAHNPNDTRITHKECMSLARAGFDVSLIAPKDGDNRPPSAIHFYPINPPQNRSHRWRQTIGDLHNKAVELDADIYHFHDPELIPVGISLRLRGKQVIYDVHENLPAQIMSKHWIPAAMRKPIALIAKLTEAAVANLFSGIVAATPTIAQRFPQNKTATVQNFPSLEELNVQDPNPYAQRPQWVGYIGGISEIRGIFEMLRALELVDCGLFDFKLAGQFSNPELEQRVIQMDAWKRLDYLGWQSREGVGQLLQSLRLGIVALHPVPNYIDSYPVKMFEYMAAGVPVIASDFPLWRSIVEEAGCGLLVNPLDPSKLSQAICQMLSDPERANQMGTRGRKSIEEKYNWHNEEAKLLALYKKLSHPNNAAMKSV